MIYVTGDLHGDYGRLTRFRRGLLRKNPTLLVCGDFGFVWNGSEEEQKMLRRIERLDCTILFVEGTHDNLTLLSQCPEEEVCGAKARRAAKNVYWLQRGEIYTVEGKTVFALGGAESPDAEDREEGVTWWREECPSSEELRHAAENLLARENGVDVILTHQNPGVVLGEIGGTERLNRLQVFLRRVMEEVPYGHWYFGGEHLDRAVSPHLTAVFEKVLPLDEAK